jgi:hypothetical protein
MSIKTVNDYLSKLSDEDILILRDILKGHEPVTFNDVVAEGIKHNQKLIDENQS